jgi:membrane fusion protein, heavy metal efflux system
MFISRQNAFLVGSLVVVIFAGIGAAPAQDPGAQARAPLETLSVRIAVPGPGAHPPALNSTSGQADRPLVVRESAPHLIREGQLIKIPQGSPLRTELTTATVAGKEIERTFTLAGVVEADPSRTVQVLAPVAGRVIDVKVELGDRVATNQELALVYAGVANWGDRRAQSTPALPNKLTASDRSNLGDAVNDCERLETEPLRSTPRLCALFMPAEGIQETRLFSLRAPVAGSVIDVGIRPGIMLDDPSSSIMTIANLDTIWVTTSLHKKDAGLIAPGRPVEIAFIAYPNEVFIGEARFIGDTIDPYASRFRVRIELPNPRRRLKPNMSALATFSAPKERVAIIPATALIQKNGRDRVFVEVERWIFEARPVEVDFSPDDQTVVVSGLNIGDRIIVVGGALLED